MASIVFWMLLMEVAMAGFVFISVFIYDDAMSEEVFGGGLSC